MENKVLISVLLLVIAVLGYRSYKSYEDVNKLLANEIIIAKVVNIHDSELNTPGGIMSFLVTEFPSQVLDFKGKIPPAK